MLPLRQALSFSLELSFKLWLLFCVSTLSNEADGIPTAETVTKARCYANCLTQNPSANAGEEPCQTQGCKDCLIPCGRTFIDVTTCKQGCNSNSSCLKSCEFLTVVKKFSSIFTGDGFLPPTPSIPTVKNRKHTSISLEWVPVDNTSGSPVYMVEMAYSASRTMYLSEVSFTPNYTVTLQQLCIPKRRRGFGGSKYDPTFYKFRVAVLTENSSLAYGQQTQITSLVKPNPVANVSVRSFIYDPAYAGDKVKLTASWTASNETQHLVTQFGMEVTPGRNCRPPYFVRTQETTGPQTSASLYIYQRLTTCEHILKVYSLISCSPSSAVTLRYTYPGCQNITDFPTSLCYQFDPPDAPIEDRIVRNVRLRGPLAPQADYRFNGAVIWDPPVYPFKEVQSYVVKTMIERPTANTGFVYQSHGSSQHPRYTLKDLLPGTTYQIQVRVNFRDNLPWSAWNSINITTPDVIPVEVAVRNLTIGSFVPSPGGGSFVANISWQKPSFNYSLLTKYLLSYKVGSNNAIQGNTSATHFLIFGILHGEQIHYRVEPVYQHGWVKGKQVSGNAKAPVPLDGDVKVKNLQVGEYLAENGTDTFFVNFSWTAPAFNFTFRSYEITYELTGYNTKKSKVYNVNVTSLPISGIFPREGISLKVTPVYSNKHIIGQVIEKRITAPEPKEDLVKVIGLKYDKLVPGPKNTFGTTVRWEKPLFTHSEVKHYIYKVMAANEPPTRRKRDASMNTDIKTYHTNATISGIDQRKDVEFQVTPVFVVSAVTGKNDRIMLSWKDESGKGAVSNKLSPGAVGGLIAGVMILALLIICLMVWNYLERQNRRSKKGIVSGKNALMIDEWEVDGDLLSLEEELGEGAFGKVYKGILKEENTLSQKLSGMHPVNALTKNAIKQTKGCTVAVKMLHGMADNEQRREFLEEIQLMKAVGSHKNIVNMVGCCTVEEPMFLLTEYIPYGDLLHYLRKRRGKVKEYLGDESRGPYRSTYCETYVIDGRKSEGISIKATRSDHIYVNTPDAPKADDRDIQIISFTQKQNEKEHLGTENKGMAEDDWDKDSEQGEDGLTQGDLLAFAWQISQGMEYLAKKGFVHRDLAARNVLVGEHKVAKVADFGLTRHVYEEKVYHAKRNRKLPLKWMSIEAIFDQTFTTQSDVWAFGVLLWELVTLGGTPYPTINNRELLRLLKGGYRMEKPDICNDEIYEMMTQCWMESADKRPNFTQIRENLETMMQIDNPYLDFSALDESRDYYNVPSFNSLEEEASDDEILDKGEADDFQEQGGVVNKGEEKLGDDSSRNELYSMSQAFKRLDKVDNNPFSSTFDNNNLHGNDFRDLKDVKVHLEAIEMSLYRPGNRAIVL